MCVTGLAVPGPSNYTADVALSKKPRRQDIGCIGFIFECDKVLHWSWVLISVRHRQITSSQVAESLRMTQGLTPQALQGSLPIGLVRS